MQKRDVMYTQHLICLLRFLAQAPTLIQASGIETEVTSKRRGIVDASQMPVQ